MYSSSRAGGSAGLGVMTMSMYDSQDSTRSREFVAKNKRDGRLDFSR